MAIVTSNNPKRQVTKFICQCENDFIRLYRFDKEALIKAFKGWLAVNSLTIAAIDSCRLYELMLQAIEYKENTTHEYRVIKKRYALKDEHIALFFGYKTLASFRNSPAKLRHAKGVVMLFKHIEERLYKQ